MVYSCGGWLIYCIYLVWCLIYLVTSFRVVCLIAVAFVWVGVLCLLPFSFVLCYLFEIGDNCD